jgi:hypothetical protein
MSLAFELRRGFGLMRSGIITSRTTPPKLHPRPHKLHPRPHKLYPRPQLEKSQNGGQSASAQFAGAAMASEDEANTRQVLTTISRDLGIPTEIAANVRLSGSGDLPSVARLAPAWLMFP